jgi:hypothetical protein
MTKGRQLPATDRPVTVTEIFRGLAVRDFDITLIALNREDSNQNQGVASVGTEVKGPRRKARLRLPTSHPGLYDWGTCGLWS